jgi:hypothetical protein
MQVSATLIAAQQAAREARARLQLPQVSAPEAPKANFAAALEKTSGFSALPLKQTAPARPQAPVQAQPQASGRMGQHVNIIV